MFILLSLLFRCIGHSESGISSLENPIKIDINTIDSWNAYEDIIFGRKKDDDKDKDKDKENGKDKDKSKIPGSGYIIAPGFQSWRVCANAYFLKNTIYALIQTLEFQKQIAIMTGIVIENGSSSTTSASSTQSTTMSSSNAGSSTGSSSESSTGSTESTTSGSVSESTSTTTVSTTVSSDSTTSTSFSSSSGSSSVSSTVSTDSTTSSSQTTISPQVVQELLQLLSDIITILPDLLSQFAAVNGGGSNTAADEPIPSEQYEVTDKVQGAIDRLNLLDKTMQNINLTNQQHTLKNSTNLLTSIIKQAMHDVSILAPGHEKVVRLVRTYGNIIIE